MAVPQYLSTFLKHYKCHDQFPNDSNYERLKAIVKLPKGEILKGTSRKKKLIVQQKYKIEVIDGEDVLLCRRSGKRVLKQSQFFSAMEQCHDLTGHPGRDLTHKRLQEKFVCVPRELIVGFIKNCDLCRNRRSILKIVQSEFDDSLDTTDDLKGNLKHYSRSSSTVCDNCNNAAENKRVSTITIEDDYNIMNTDIPVWDAIAYIYGVSSKEIQDFSKQYSNKSTSARIDSTVNLCDACMPLLSENYKSHKKFNEASNSVSIIQQFSEFCKSRGSPSAKHKVESDISCSSSADIRTENPDYVDNLFDDFNFDDDENETGSLLEEDNFSEQKHEPTKDSMWTRNEINVSVDTEGRVTRGSLKAKAYVKLEKLSEDYRSVAEMHGISLNFSESERSDLDSDYQPEEDDLMPKRVKRQRQSVKRKPSLAKKTRKKNLRKEIQSISDITDVDMDDTSQSSEIPEKAGESSKTSEESSDGKTVYQCDKCEKTFMNKNTFKHHRRIHNDNPSYYNCKICGRSYRQSSYSAFRDHVLSHSGEKRFECPTCNERFQRRSQLDAHKRVHIKEFNFSCEQCGKSFKLLGQLNGHRMIHTNEEHICADCNRCFKSKEYLKIHRKRVHSGQKFICEECGSTFSQRYSLTLHVKRLHKNELIYECEICGKHLSSDVRLKTHMWTHTGEKPLVCKVEGCDSKFSNQDAFDAHVRSHSGIKFECTVCGKKFDRKQYLKWHFRVHTGEKPKKRIPKLKTGSEIDPGQTESPSSRVSDLVIAPHQSVLANGSFISHNVETAKINY